MALSSAALLPGDKKVWAEDHPALAAACMRAMSAPLPCAGCTLLNTTHHTPHAITNHPPLVDLRQPLMRPGVVQAVSLARPLHPQAAASDCRLAPPMRPR